MCIFQVGSPSQSVNVWNLQNIAYIHQEQVADEPGRKKQSNADMLVNTVKAIEEICPSLDFWTFQTGGKVCSMFTPLEAAS